MKQKNKRNRPLLKSFVAFAVCMLLLVGGSLWASYVEEESFISGVAFLAGTLGSIIVDLYWLHKFYVWLEKRQLKRYGAPAVVSYPEIRAPGGSDAAEEPDGAPRLYNDGGPLQIENGARISWPIVFCLMVIPPVGGWMLLRKILFEKSRYRRNGFVMIVAGTLVAVFTGGILVPVLVDEPSSQFWETFGEMSFLALFFLIGVILLVVGAVLFRRGVVNDMFMILITNRGVTDLRELSALSKRRYSRVCAVIRRLIRDGLLPDAYLYFRDHELIVPGISKKTAVRCKNCMGTTVGYANEISVCEYCGGEL